jgi:hypothetical protein
VASILAVSSHDGVVSSKAVLACPNDGRRCTLLLLCENLGDDDGIWIYAIDDAPGLASVLNPELVATRPNARHRPGMGHAKELARLELSQQEASLNA